MGSVEFTSDQQFEAQVLSATTPVLLDFTATWCQPCKAIAPLLEAMVPEYQGRLKIMKLDVDENPTTAMRYMVLAYLVSSGFFTLAIGAHAYR